MDREISSIEDALTLLEEWAAAYQELQRDHLRLLWEQSKLRDAYGHAAAVIENDLWYEQQLAKHESKCPF